MTSRYYRWVRVAIFAEKSRLWWVYCSYEYFRAKTTWRIVYAALSLTWRVFEVRGCFKDIVDVMVFSGGFHRDRYRKSERGTRQFDFTDFTEIEFAD